MYITALTWYKYIIGKLNGTDRRSQQQRQQTIISILVMKCSDRTWQRQNKPVKLPGYFREPHWKSMGLPEISGVTWQVCRTLIRLRTSHIIRCHDGCQLQAHCQKQRQDAKSQRIGNDVYTRHMLFVWRRPDNKNPQNMIVNDISIYVVIKTFRILNSYVRNTIGTIRYIF